jgi:hypothetical protein
MFLPSCEEELATDDNGEVLSLNKQNPESRRETISGQHWA